MHPFTSILGRAAHIAVGMVIAGCALAQDYPAKPVRLIVPYPPGGPTDIVARVIGQKLSAQTGQQFRKACLQGPPTRRRDGQPRDARIRLHPWSESSLRPCLSRQFGPGSRP